MLIELDIRDFALINHVALTFHKGFTVLTGETGAGKSIIIDAVGLCLGGRGDRELVKSGAEKARIQAVYDVDGCDDVLALLSEVGVEIGEDRQLIVNRDLFGNGRSICRLNGLTVTQQILKKIMSRLMDIHGQHEHQSLLDQSRHVGILDAYGGKELESLKKDFQMHYQTVLTLKKELERLGTSDQERARQLDFLQVQIEEIDEANLKTEEEDELKERNAFLRHGQQIFQTLGAFHEGVYEGGEYPSALDLLGQHVKELFQLAHLSSPLEELSIRAEEVRINLEELCRDVRSYHEEVDFLPEELESIQQRLELINQLKRKYGSSIEEILDFRESLQDEMDELINSAERYQNTMEKLAVEKEMATALAHILSKARKETAKKLQIEMEDILATLNMGKVSFSVDQQMVEMKASGMDEISFMISTNQGEPLKPLSKIASGGEMSRIMLAFKTLFARIDAIPTLIFDEIDAGIGGRTAQVVGEKLAYVSQNHQVICITHLPQIAAMAQHHFQIEKRESGKKTSVRVNTLQEEERLHELGRLLDGTVTDITLQHAREMLKTSQSNHHPS